MPGVAAEEVSVSAAAAAGIATGSVGRISGLRWSSGIDISYVSKTSPPVFKA